MSLPRTSKKLLALLPLPLLYLMGNATNVPLAKTGANGEQTCAQCHVGTPNTRGGRVRMELPGLPYYTPGSPMHILVRVYSPTPNLVMGFQLTVRRDLNPEQSVGSFRSSLDVRVDTVGGVEYASHSAALQPFGKEAFIDVVWTPPVTSAGNVRFYVAAVAGVNDQVADGKDEVYTASLAVSPASDDIPSGYKRQTITAPGNVTGLSNNGKIVGYGLLSFAGFVRQEDGTSTVIRVDGASRTVASGVNNLGEVVGTYYTNDGKYHGFFRSATGVITKYDYPGAQSTELNAINDSSRIAGGFVDASGGHGLLLDSSLQSTTVVDSVLGTGLALVALNNGGSYVGRLTTPPQFLLGRPGYEKPIAMFPCPGSDAFPGLMGLNDFGEAAGWCRDLRASGVSWTSETLTGSGIVNVLSAGTSQPTVGPLFGAVNNSRQLLGQDSLGNTLLSPCTVTASGDVATPFPAVGGVVTFGMTAAQDCSWNIITGSPEWITFSSGSGNGQLSVTMGANTFTQARTGVFYAGGRKFVVQQAGGSCDLHLTNGPTTLPTNGGTSFVRVATSNGCSWTAQSSADWLRITNGTSGNGSGSVDFQVVPNPGPARSATLTIGNQVVVVNQGGTTGCSFTLSAAFLNVPALGGVYPVTVSATQELCTWTATSDVTWATVPLQTRTGSGQLSITVTNYSAFTSRTGTLTIAGQTFRVTQAAAAGGQGLVFMPVTPCRVADTRPGGGMTGAYGPPRVNAEGTRDFVMSGVCGIPSSARAVAINVTSVPVRELAFLTVFPAGQTRPLASTSNSWNGRVVANTTIVPLGTNGAISIFASDATDVIVDVSGYFKELGAVPGGGYEYVPLNTSRFATHENVEATSSDEGGVATARAVQPMGGFGNPNISNCRLMDTRVASGNAFNGPPFLQGNMTRLVHLLRQPGCSVESASAYYLNITVVPKRTLGFLTVYPAGQPQPLASTLNSSNGQVVANGVLVPAGTNGDINVYASDDTDVIIDMVGVFVTPTVGVSSMKFFPLAPCRLLDMRNSGVIPQNGTVQVDSLATSCGVSASAGALMVNATVVPPGFLGYLTLYSPLFEVPLASTLNSWDGQVVANLAIVQTGLSGGKPGVINAFASNPTYLILDVLGYFE